MPWFETRCIKRALQSTLYQIAMQWYVVVDLRAPPLIYSVAGQLGLKSSRPRVNSALGQLSLVYFQSIHSYRYMMEWRMNLLLD